MNKEFSLVESKLINQLETVDPCWG